MKEGSRSRIGDRELRELLEQHNTWVNSGGQNGARAVLAPFDLEEADLRRANLKHASLGNTDLRHASLEGACLEGAMASHSNLGNADLRHARLAGADLRSADLRNARLLSADLHGANLAHANLSGASLVGANLMEANLRGSNLRSADLRDADLLGASFHEADLRGTRFDEQTVSRSRWSIGLTTSIQMRGAMIGSREEQRPAEIPAAVVGGHDSSRPNMIALDVGTSPALDGWSEHVVRRLHDKGIVIDAELHAALGAARVRDAIAVSAYRPFPKELVDRLDELTVLRHEAEEAADRSELREHQEAINAFVHQLMATGTPRPGDTVVGARLVRVVGSGNFGDVWQADADGKKVAVKIFHASKLGLALALHHFRRGVDAMRHLNERPGRPSSVIELLLADDANLAFSMPFTEKIDLAKAARHWELPTKLRLFRTLCEAVEFAHRHGVRHRDIKPENILLTADLQPVLTDFDISDLLYKKTMSAKGVGAITYAAPEQLMEARDTGNTVDIYSLGRVLHFLLLDRDPPLGGEEMPVLADLSNHPRGIVRIVRKCTLRNASARYQEVRELLLDLAAYEGKPDSVGVGTETRSSNAIASPNREPLWRSAPFMGTATAFATLVGVLAKSCS